MTRNLTNYHSHCSLCDGRAPMEDFVREAVRRGFTSYGISCLSRPSGRSTGAT